jgi:threonine dehydratase
VIPLASITRARETLRGVAVRTPLVRLRLADVPAEIHLKLECLQPIGSFKIRGAMNAMAEAPPEALARGVVTASAGNMAQGVAWGARERGVPCTVVVPDTAPQTKLEAIERLGGRILPVPFEDWWRAIETSQHPGAEGYFVHPVLDDGVMAGNGTIGLEILGDAPDVDAIVVPYGGGGLSCGIASAVRASRPDVRVYAAEVATAAPLSAALAEGKPTTISSTPSFVDGIGGKGVFADMWPMARELLAGSLVVSVEEVAAAVRLLAERNRVVAEGAGAAPVAAALNRTIDAKTIVCIISGGNIDSDTLATILRGEIPIKEH